MHWHEEVHIRGENNFHVENNMWKTFMNREDDMAMCLMGVEWLFQQGNWSFLSSLDGNPWHVNLQGHHGVISHPLHI